MISFLDKNGKSSNAIFGQWGKQEVLEEYAKLFFPGHAGRQKTFVDLTGEVPRAYIVSRLALEEMLLETLRSIQKIRSDGPLPKEQDQKVNELLFRLTRKLIHPFLATGVFNLSLHSNYENKVPQATRGLARSLKSKYPILFKDSASRFYDNDGFIVDEPHRRPWKRI